MRGYETTIGFRTDDREWPTSARIEGMEAGRLGPFLNWDGAEEETMLVEVWTGGPGTFWSADSRPIDR